MAFNPQPNDHQAPLSTWGGLVTQTHATKLPEGVSPSCYDMQFVPGSVSSRSGFQKVFASAFGSVTVTYAKSYVDPLNVIRNLYLDSAGNLWVENVTASAGIYTLLATTTPGSYAKSITVFGREYIAISDGLHGTDIPYQYDGTNFDRVTQSGPGASPNVANLIIPPTVVAASASPLSLTIVEVDPENPDPSSGFFTSINVYTSTALTGVAVGQSVVISGTGTAFDGAWGPVNAFFTGSPNSLIQISAYIPAGTVFWTGSATMAIQQGALQRQSNIVTGTTTSAHQLRPGYQVQITNAQAGAIGTGVSSIVINNENTPGIATVTVGLGTGQTNHGLVPGMFVSITGVKAVAVGSGISSISRTGQVVTVILNAAAALNPGAIVTVAGVTPSSFNTGAVAVASVTTTTNTGDTFTFVQVDVDATGSGGTVSLNWPIPDTETPTYFEVQAAPSATTFQVAVNYSDGTWTTGAVAYAWNGTFYVQTTPSTTSFTYQQYGPDASASPVSGASITVTPYGQASPGSHQFQVSFITRQSYITAPSPPVTVVLNGGQYVSVTNLPIGPPNVTGRIIEVTGAQGAYFFYIPEPPQVNGQLVGTQTQINDNTTTSVILDFADNTLFAAIGISVQGNNLANQIVLDGALGFGFYGSRLLTYGQRNIIQNLLNMGFEGGYLPNANTLPAGWTYTGSGGALASGHSGEGWQITVAHGGGNLGKLSQSFYQDYSGAPIATANTPYKIRVWLKTNHAVSDLTFTMAITSASASFSTTATVIGTSMSTAGSFVEAAFAAGTPTPIPADLTLSLYASSTATDCILLVDELNIIYVQTPYTDEILNGSYVDNPEAFDGVSGPFGPSEDTHKVMDFGIIRETFYLLTRDPSGRIHEVINNGVTEPASWDVEEVAANCGAVSAFSVTKSQADDSSASGGEEWFAWAAFGQARIFGGGEPWKISQEIQPDWDSINPAAALTTWSLNDPVARVIYFGLPVGGGSVTAPSKIYHVNYRELDSASAIAGAAPVHVGFNGKLTAHDNARKWCPWNLTVNGAALMYRAAGAVQPVFFAGNSLYPNTSSANAYGNVFTLNPAKLTDDSYGQIHPFYYTYFMLAPEVKQALQIGSREMISYLKAQVSGVGNITVTAYPDLLSNPWSLTCVRTLATSPKFDLEWSGANCVGDNIAIGFVSAPATGTDNQLIIKSLVVWLRTNARLPIRGSAS